MTTFKEDIDVSCNFCEDHSETEAHVFGNVCTKK